ncbi:MAG: hypothetical protein ABMB14_10995 [Myxococcota bacterium]
MAAQLGAVDLDGICGQGWDDDGDGFCASDGEPAAFGDAVDCNDAVDGAGCLTIGVGPLVHAAPFTVTVDHARPNETVELVWSKTAGATCPSRLGGLCYGITKPKSLGMRTASPSGTATFSITLPAGTARLQAVVVRSGLTSDLSPVRVVVVP